MSTGGEFSGRAFPARDVLRRIEWLVLDVDGVLTDGRVHYDAEGRESKAFHVHDDAGVVYWNRTGGKSAFLSGRAGRAVEKKAEELGVHEPILGRIDKATAFAELLRRRGVAADRVAYMGDDLLDLPVLKQVAFAATVPEAAAEVRAVVHHVTRARAGFGAVREVVEILLRARDAWQPIVDRGGLP